MLGIGVTKCVVHRDEYNRRGPERYPDAHFIALPQVAGVGRRCPSVDRRSFPELLGRLEFLLLKSSNNLLAY